MKVLLLTTHLDMGGIPVYVTSLARGLRQSGHEPVVVSSGGWLESRLAAEASRRTPLYVSLYPLYGFIFSSGRRGWLGQPCRRLLGSPKIALDQP